MVVAFIVIDKDKTSYSNKHCLSIRHLYYWGYYQMDMNNFMCRG